MSGQIDEDAIDLLDLQAQIDLSMSFAQNLVSSWVGSGHYSRSKRQRDLESEMKEYMRHPARLGVGAQIPETQNLAREAARLKSKLEGGKKRQREQEEACTKTFQSDDDGESRSGAIKKKARLDPFSVTSRGNKKKGCESNEIKGPTIHPAAMKVMSQKSPTRAEPKDNQEANEVEMDLFTSGSLSTPQENTKRKPRLTHSHGPNGQPQRMKQAKLALLSDEESIGSGAPPPKPSTPSKHSEPSALGTAASPDASPSGGLPAFPMTHPQFIDVSQTTSPLRSPGHQRLGIELLKRPVLNLRGSLSEDEAEESDKPTTSDRAPKKKRKRRKKKKVQQTVSTK